MAINLTTPPDIQNETIRFDTTTNNDDIHFTILPSSSGELVYFEPAQTLESPAYNQMIINTEDVMVFADGSIEFNNSDETMNIRDIIGLKDRVKILENMAKTQKEVIDKFFKVKNVQRGLRDDC